MRQYPRLNDLVSAYTLIAFVLGKLRFRRAVWFAGAGTVLKLPLSEESCTLSTVC